MVSVFEVLDQRVDRKAIRPDGGSGVECRLVMHAVGAGCGRAVCGGMQRECAAGALIAYESGQISGTGCTDRRVAAGQAAECAGLGE